MGFIIIQTICKYLERKFKKNIPEIRTEYYVPNQANRTIVEDMTKILFKLAEEKAKWRRQWDMYT